MEVCLRSDLKKSRSVIRPSKMTGTISSPRRAASCSFWARGMYSSVPVVTSKRMMYLAGTRS